MYQRDLHVFKSHSAKGTIPSPASAGIAKGVGAGEGCLLLPQNSIPETREVDGSL